MSVWYVFLNALGIRMFEMDFMKNALLAVLLLGPLFGLLSTMIVTGKMSFFSDALGHSGFTGIAIGVLCGAVQPIYFAVGLSVLFALLFSYVRARTNQSADTVIGVFSSTAVALGIFIATMGGGSFTKFNKYLIGDILSVTPLEIGLLALVLLCTTGCSDWEAADDPLGELSSFYQTENDEPEPEPLTALTLPYVSGETLDPVTATDTVQQTVGALLYEGLFALDQQFQPQPVLADSWEYDSQRLVWTIRIRADALFSDGSAVTAQDVAATLERARTSARYAQRLEDVTGSELRGRIV